jgi:hypothetical protein
MVTTEPREQDRNAVEDAARAVASVTVSWMEPPGLMTRVAGSVRASGASRRGMKVRTRRRPETRPFLITREDQVRDMGYGLSLGLVSTWRRHSLPRWDSHRPLQERQTMPMTRATEELSPENLPSSPAW